MGTKRRELLIFCGHRLQNAAKFICFMSNKELIEVYSELKIALILALKNMVISE